MCLTVSRQSRDLRPLSRDRSMTFFKTVINCLKRPKNVGWQSTDGRVTFDNFRVTVQWLFSKFFQIAWNVGKTLFDSGPTVAWPPTNVAWPFSDFLQIFLIAWNVQKTLLDSWQTVAWPPTTVAWPFSDFFQNFSQVLETSKKRCLTAGRRSRNLRPLSRDRSVTFFRNCSQLLETSKKRCLTAGQRSRDLRPLSRDRSVTFFKITRKCLKRPKNVVWQSADGRVTSDHCRVTVQWLYSKNFLIAWNVQKRCLTAGRRSRNLRPLSRDRSVSFFRNCSQLLETSKKRCLTAGQRSRNLRPLSRDRSVTFFKITRKCLKRPKNVVWQSADGRVTSDHCRVTVQWLYSKFSWLLGTSKNVVWKSADGRVTSDHCRVTVQWLLTKFFLFAWTSKKLCLTAGRRSSDLRQMPRDRSVTFFKIFPGCLKPSKNVAWQSDNGRVTSDHCRVTVQWLSSKFFLVAWNLQKTSLDNRTTVAWPPTTVTWPISDFFQNCSKLLETSKKRCLTVGRRSRDFRPLSRDCSVIFFEIHPNCLKRPKNVDWQSADGRVTYDQCRVTVQWLLTKFYVIAWSVQKTLFDSRPTVAWPPTTVAWPFSDFFQNFSKVLEASKKRCLTVGRRSRNLKPLSRDRSVTSFKIVSNCLKRPKNFVWQSADGRLTSDHVSVTVQRFFSKFFPIAWNVEKALFDSEPTVAWPPTNNAWLFSDCF